ALIMMLVTVAGLTSFQNPLIWPRFFRYLTLVCGTLAFLSIWDHPAHRLGLTRLEVSPGSAVCILMAVLSVLGAWYHILGNPGQEMDGKRAGPTRSAE